MNPVAICTIASHNYLAFARVLAESYRDHHPGAEVFVCIVDRPDAAVSYAGMPFTPIFAHELEIPAFENFAFRYDVVELNTAVKPYLLTHLRDHYGLDCVFYFDPDILILDHLAGLERALEQNSAVLTPHITQPLDNEHRPPERFIRMTGVYNLGFLGIQLNERTRKFLEWWKKRLYRFCVVDPQNGLFVDQSWMDLAPAFLDAVALMRDPIYNIAYWNLAHRRVRVREDRWEVDGRRAGFFHFSGVELDDLEVVSRHQDRIRLDSRPELRPCFEHYRNLILGAGHERLCVTRYGYGTFLGAEIPVPALARRVLQRIDPCGRRWPNPFEVHTHDSFCDWLSEPLEFDRGYLNRLVLSLWEERPDLVLHFRWVCDEDLPRFVEWLTVHGEGEKAGLHPSFLEGVRGKRAEGERRAAGGSHPLDFFDPSAADSTRSLLQTIDLTNPRQLAGWLNQPIAGTAHSRPRLTHLSMLIHQVRGDLQQVFPDPLDEHQLSFALWFVNEAAMEYRLHPELVAPIRRSLPVWVRLKNALLGAREWGKKSFLRSGTSAAAPAASRFEHGPEPLREAASVDAASGAPERPLRIRTPSKKRLPRGVNLAGYFGHLTGVGQMGRASAIVLERAGVEVARVPLDADRSGKTVRGQLHQPDGLPFPVTLLNVNADETPRALTEMPLAATLRSHKIGYWYWELSHFPLAFADRFQLLDEIWAPSSFAQSAYRTISTIPVRHVPPFVPVPEPADLERSHFGLDEDRFYFFFAFDVLSVPERKNPFAALEAIRRLQERVSRPVGLVLKVSSARGASELMGRLRQRAEGLPITFYTRQTSREELEAMLGCCDAVLSLHRSEGLGLLPIEGLLLDKPVVATDYGGVTDFLDQATSYPVEYELEQLEHDSGPYPRGAVWASPRLEHAVELMQRVVERPDEAAARAAQGKRRVRQLYGLEAAVERFSRELDRIFAELESARLEPQQCQSPPVASNTGC